MSSVRWASSQAFQSLSASQSLKFGAHNDFFKVRAVETDASGAFVEEGLLGGQRAKLSSYKTESSMGGFRRPWVELAGLTNKGKMNPRRSEIGETLKRLRIS